MKVINHELTPLQEQQLLSLLETVGAKRIVASLISAGKFHQCDGCEDWTPYEDMRTVKSEHRHNEWLCYNCADIVESQWERYCNAIEEEDRVEKWIEAQYQANNTNKGEQQ